MKHILWCLARGGYIVGGRPHMDLNISKIIELAQGVKPEHIVHIITSLTQYKTLLFLNILNTIYLHKMKSP